MQVIQEGRLHMLRRIRAKATLRRRGGMRVRECKAIICPALHARFATRSSRKRRWIASILPTKGNNMTRVYMPTITSCQMCPSSVRYEISRKELSYYAYSCKLLGGQEVEPTPNAPIDCNCPLPKLNSLGEVVR